MSKPKKPSSKRLIIIDGDSLFHRAYHALPTTLTNSAGQPINAVYGFSNMLIKMIADLKPDYVAVCFDTAAPTFRHVDFEEYKATRMAPPDDMYPQMPKVKGVLDAFGMPFFELEGYEADDLIATLTTQALRKTPARQQGGTNAKRLPNSKAGLTSKKALDHSRLTLDKIIIFTADRDTLQLVNNKVNVRASGQKLNQIIIFDKQEVQNRYGVTPSQMNDFKALVGDPSDNIAGVAGVGPKTASELLKQYKNLESIYAHIDAIAEPLKSKLIEGKKVAFKARELVSLDKNAPIEFRVKSLEFSPDWEKVRSEFEKLRFKSLVAKIPEKEIKKEASVSKKN